MTLFRLHTVSTRRESIALCGLLVAMLFSLFANLAYSTETQTKNIPKPDIDAELREVLKATIAKSDSFVDEFDAEVWLIHKSQRLEKFIPDPVQRLEMLRSIHRAATAAQLQPEVVLAVIEVESHFNPFAISHAGAQGIMQVMPFWKNEIGRPGDNLFNLETNLRYGCTILKHYLDKTDGHIADALARYNGSYGTYKYTEKVMVAWQERWR